MWLFDKVKSGYKRVVNKILEIALRADSVRLAQFAIISGAERFPSHRDEQGYVSYPLLGLCKSKRMVQTLTVGSRFDEFSIDQIMLFAVRNNLLSVAEYFIECGAKPDVGIVLIIKIDRSNRAQLQYKRSIPLISECQSEAMRSLLIDAILKRSTRDRTVSLFRCFEFLVFEKFSEAHRLSLVMLVNKLLEKELCPSLEIKFMGYNLLHLLARYSSPISKVEDPLFSDIVAWFDKIMSLHPYLLHMRDSRGSTPLDFVNDDQYRRQQWRNMLETKGYIEAAEQPKPLITDRYVSMKGQPRVEHLCSPTSEDRIFFTKNSNSM